MVQRPSLFRCSPVEVRLTRVSTTLDPGGMVGRMIPEQLTIRSDDFFSRLACSAPEDEIKKIVGETRADYMSSFISLLQKLTVPRDWLWF